MDWEQRALRAEADASALREQLSQLQDKWMELEQWSDDAKRRLRVLEGSDDSAEGSPRDGSAVPASPAAGDATVASIETLYREKNSALHRQLKEAKRAARESAAQADAQLKRALKKIETHKTKARAAQDEAAQLRERAFELQQALEAKQAAVPAAPAATASFDLEGQFQLLYKETLQALNEERDARREAAMSARTELQNVREELDAAVEDAVGLRADVEVRKLREKSLRFVGRHAHAKHCRLTRSKQTKQHCIRH